MNYGTRNQRLFQHLPPSYIYSNRTTYLHFKTPKVQKTTFTHCRQFTIKTKRVRQLFDISFSPAAFPKIPPPIPLSPNYQMSIINKLKQIFFSNPSSEVVNIPRRYGISLAGSKIETEVGSLMASEIPIPSTKFSMNRTSSSFAFVQVASNLLFFRSSAPHKEKKSEYCFVNSLVAASEIFELVSILRTSRPQFVFTIANKVVTITPFELKRLTQTC